MLILSTILSIAIASYSPQIFPAIITREFGDFIKKELQSKRLSCIVDNRYQSQFYIDSYRCGKTEDLKRKFPYRLFSPDYPYVKFDIMWHYKRGKTIKNASKKDKILFNFDAEFMNYKTPKGTSTKEVSIIDDDSKYLWKVLEKYTCFRMNHDRRVIIEMCR